MEPNLSEQTPLQTPAPRAAPELGQAFRDLGTSLKNLAFTAVDESKKRVIETGNEIREGANQLARDTLDKIGANPEKQKGIVSEVVRVLPLIGPTTAYADAWKLWKNAKAAGNEPLMDQAREKCLVALADAGVDIVLLGSRTLGVVANVSRKALAPLLKTRLARALGIPQHDVVKSLVDNVAHTEPARSIATYLLDSFHPTRKVQDLGAQAPKIEQALDGLVDQHAPAPPGTDQTH